MEIQVDIDRKDITYNRQSSTDLHEEKRKIIFIGGRDGK